MVAPQGAGAFPLRCPGWSREAHCEVRPRGMVVPHSRVRTEPGLQAVWRLYGWMATRLVIATFLVRNAKDVEPSAPRLRWLRDHIILTALVVDVPYASVQPRRRWARPGHLHRVVANCDCIVRNLVRARMAGSSPAMTWGARVGFSGGWYYTDQGAFAEAIRLRRETVSDFVAIADHLDPNGCDFRQ